MPTLTTEAPAPPAVPPADDHGPGCDGPLNCTCTPPLRRLDPATDMLVARLHFARTLAAVPAVLAVPGRWAR